MKLLLVALLLCGHVCRADKIYHLECLFDKYRVSLLLYDDSTFELAGIDCIDNECDVLMIACGRYMGTGEGIELVDKLWHNRMQLKNVYGQWIITSGTYGLFNKALFIKYDHATSFEDNSLKLWTEEMVRRQKLAKDSILDNCLWATLCFERGVYSSYNYTIKFGKRKRYSYSIGKHIISTGKASRHGNYLVLKDDVSREQFMLEIDEQINLEVVYLPMMIEGGTFRLSASSDYF